MIEDVNERNEREICAYGRVLTDAERRELGALDAKADASAAELRAERENQNLIVEQHHTRFGHYPTKGFPEEPCLFCQAAAAKAKANPEAPQQLHGDAIECPQCKHVMLRTEVADYRAHSQECVAYEIRTRRNEATMSELARRLVALESPAVAIPPGAAEQIQKLQWECDELRVSLLALARLLLTPGDCLAPDAPMYCGGSDLCPCRSDSGFHGTCGINAKLVELINEHVKAHPEHWRYMAPDATAHLPEEHWKEHFRRIALRIDRNYDALEKRVAKGEKEAAHTADLARSAHAGAYPQGCGR
jgi:hypothetical protein